MTNRPPPTPATPVQAVDPPTGREWVDGPPIAYLVELTGSNPGVQHRIEGRVVVGRGVDADLRLDESDVSRRHAEVHQDADGAFHIQDLGSRHGLRINGQPSVGGPLKSGDRLGFGSEAVLLFTLRDRVEERLLHSQRMASLGRLAGGVAHDFNNLVGALLTNVAFLRRLSDDTSVQDPRVVETLEDCGVALERAGALTQSLLGFARRGRHASEPMELSDLAAQVVRLLVDRSGLGRTFELAVPQGLIVRGDPAQLQQVVMNICLNAQDAVGSEGRVIVRGRVAAPTDFEALGLTPAPERRVLLQVVDDGPGMDARTRQQAFEPFFTTKPVGQGTGLGLASVYGIVEQHGGAVHLDSSPGEGTVVSVLLPAVDASGAPALRSTDTFAAKTARSASARLLVVDDEPLVRGSTARFLRNQGYEVREADSGAAALEHLEDEIPDLILLDLRMPGMDGVETFRALRDKAPGLNFVLVSATVDDEAEGLIQEAGVVGVLAKPFDALRLAAVVQGAIQGSKSS